MKVVNKIFEKTHRDKKHPWLAHLDQKKHFNTRCGLGLSVGSANRLHPKVEE